MRLKNLITKPRWNQGFKVFTFSFQFTSPSKIDQQQSPIRASRNRFDRSLSVSFFLSCKKRRFCRVNQDLKDVKIGRMSVCAKTNICLFILFFFNQRLVNLSRWMKHQLKTLVMMKKKGSPSFWNLGTQRLCFQIHCYFLPLLLLLPWSNVFSLSPTRRLPTAS